MDSKVVTQESSNDSDSVSDVESSEDSQSSSMSAQEHIKPGHKNCNTKQTKNISPLFTLSCLTDWDTLSKNQCFQKYITKEQNKGTESTSKVGVPKISKVEDFTPWWDEFSKPRRKTSTVQATPKRDPDSFDNWFDKGSCAVSSSSWLSASRSPPETSKQSVPVEDIEVPSIYDQKPKTKGRRALKRERKAEREKTMGKNWFDMRAPEVDDKLRNDLEMIRMRGVLDPKRFYKHNDRRAQPKYFQVGTVEDEGTDFYSSRLTKKQRKETLVEELLADANVRQYNKRKYSEVQQKMRSKKKFKGKKSAAS